MYHCSTERDREREHQHLGNINWFQISFLNVHTFFFFSWILFEPTVCPPLIPCDIPGGLESRLHACCSVMHVLLTKSEKGHRNPYCSLKMNPQTVGPSLCRQMWITQATQYSGISCALHNSRGYYHTVVIIDLCIYHKYFLVYGNKTS